MRFGLQLGAQCAGKYEDCADDLSDEKLFAKENKREKCRRERLKITEYCNRLHLDAADGGKVQKAADAGVK